MSPHLDKTLGRFSTEEPRNGEGRDMARSVGSKFEEAQLLLRIHEMYSSDLMSTALAWFFNDFRADGLKDFEARYPPGSEERKSFWRIGNFFELMGTFLEREYLPNQLMIEFCPDDVKSFWKKARPLVVQMRGEYQDPTLYAGLEHLDQEIRKWQKGLKKK